MSGKEKPRLGMTGRAGSQTLHGNTEATGSTGQAGINQSGGRRLQEGVENMGY